jgi:integrase
MQSEYDTADNRRNAVQPIDQVVQCAMWIMLSTMCRIGEMSMARWVHVNFDSGTWFIPKENVKGNLDDLNVFLSRFALDQFKNCMSQRDILSGAFPPGTRRVTFA